MASNNDPNEPDLSSILETLSSFARPQISTASSTTPTANASHQTHPPAPFSQLARRPNNSEYTTPNPPRAATAAGGSSTDPSTITTWPPALKHIMRTVSVNDDLQARIRRLIRTQYEHEKQWWQRREALLAKQKTRLEKKRQLEEVLYV